MFRPRNASTPVAAVLPFAPPFFSVSGLHVFFFYNFQATLRGGCFRRDATRPVCVARFSAEAEREAEQARTEEGNILCLHRTAETSEEVESEA